MFSSRSIRRVATIAVVIASAIASSAAADPPGRVARVSDMSGPVSFRPSVSDEWTTATLNYPLTIGDHLWTDRGSRTELELGSVFARLAPATEFSLINLDDRLAQLRITQGVLTVRVRSLDPDDAIEIDTPNGAVSLLRPGFYRIDVGESGDASTITVRSGEAEVTAGGGPTRVRAQESLSVNGVDAQWSAMARHANRRFRGLVPGARSARRNVGRRALRPARDDRLRGSRSVRRMARGGRLRSCLDSARQRRVGAVPLRSLGLDRSVGLDLDRRCAVGIRAVPLRTLGAPLRRLGLDARTHRRASGVRAGARRVRRRIGMAGVDPRRSGTGGLVPARTARTVRARVPRLERLRAAREHHARERDERPCHHRGVRESRGAGRGHGGAA